MYNLQRCDVISSFVRQCLRVCMSVCLCVCVYFFIMIHMNMTLSVEDVCDRSSISTDVTTHSKSEAEINIDIYTAVIISARCVSM